MLAIGTKVYYTGDMANQDGHFEVTAHRGGFCYDLQERAGDREFRGVMHIATEYKGHCGDRFVTQDAWMAHRDSELVEWLRLLRSRL